MSKKQKRRRFTSAQKVSILSEHLFNKKPVSDVCEAHELQPSVLYEWQRHAQANLAEALEGQRNGAGTRRDSTTKELSAPDDGHQADSRPDSP